MLSGLETPLQEKRFLGLLAETIAWCARKGDPANAKGSLRTFEPKYCHLTSRELQVSDVCSQRLDRLRSLGEYPSGLEKSLGGGRLLAYFPDDNLAHGLAEAESDGFFDGENIPPYDTWLWFDRYARSREFSAKPGGFSDGTNGEEMSYLVSWVPPGFMKLAERGVDADPMPCIAWLDTLDTPLVKSLKRLGLLRDGLERAAIVSGGDAS